MAHAPCLCQAAEQHGGEESDGSGGRGGVRASPRQAGGRRAAAVREGLDLEHLKARRASQVDQLCTTAGGSKVGVGVTGAASRMFMVRHWACKLRFPPSES